MTKNKKTVQDLIDEVLSETKKSIELGDLTVLDELLTFVPIKNLIQSLNEDRWSDYKHMMDGDKIILTINSGCIDVQTNPHNMDIEVRDYDTDGEFGEIKEDEDGDKYQEIIL